MGFAGGKTVISFSFGIWYKHF